MGILSLHSQTVQIYPRRSLLLHLSIKDLIVSTIDMAFQDIVAYCTVILVFTNDFFGNTVPDNLQNGIENLRIENKGLSGISADPQPNCTKRFPKDTPSDIATFNNEVLISPGSMIVEGYSPGWTFHCLNMTSNLIYGSTERSMKEIKRLLSTKMNKILEENRILQKKVEELQWKFQQMKEEKEEYSLPFQNMHQHNSSPHDQFGGDRSSFDLTSGSLSSIDYSLPRFLVWVLMTAEGIVCLFRMLRKKLFSDGDETSTQLKTLKELCELKKEFEKLIRRELSQRVSPSDQNCVSNPIPKPRPRPDPPVSSSSSSSSSLPGRNMDKDDTLADFRAKLAKETAQKRKDQQQHYALIMEKQKRKHEEEMRERESRFKTVIGEQLKMDKEEFIQWTSNPD